MPEQFEPQAEATTNTSNEVRDTSYEGIIKSPYENPRIIKLVADIQKSEARLKEAIQDLEVRESDSCFQIAHKMIEIGITAVELDVDELGAEDGAFLITDPRIDEIEDTVSCFLPKEKEWLVEMFPGFGFDSDSNRSSKILNYLCDLTEESNPS